MYKSAASSGFQDGIAKQSSVLSYYSVQASNKSIKEANIKPQV